MRVRAISSQLFALFTLAAIAVAPICAPLCAAKICAPASGQTHCHDASPDDTGQEDFARQSTCRGLDLSAVLLRSDEQLSPSADPRHSAFAISVAELTSGIARVAFEANATTYLESPPNIFAVFLETTVLRI